MMASLERDELLAGCGASPESRISWEFSSKELRGHAERTDKQKQLGMYLGTSAAHCKRLDSASGKTHRGPHVEVSIVIFLY